MSALVAAITGFVAANPGLTASVAFVVAASESIVVVGALVPGTPVLMAIGAVASLGHAALAGVVAAAILGAVAGDGISYWIGHRHAGRLRDGWPFATRPALLAQGESFIRRYGIPGVALARFLPGVRAVVPVAAGMFGMRPLAFYASNVASAVVWAPLHVLPGALIAKLARLHLTDDLDDFTVPAIMVAGLLLWALWQRRQRRAAHRSGGEDRR